MSTSQDHTEENNEHTSYKLCRRQLLLLLVIVPENIRKSLKEKVVCVCIFQNCDFPRFLFSNFTDREIKTRGTQMLSLGAECSSSESRQLMGQTVTDNQDGTASSD